VDGVEAQTGALRDFVGREGPFGPNQHGADHVVVGHHYRFALGYGPYQTNDHLFRRPRGGTPPSRRAPPFSAF
jgi:hypothetical protein